MSGKDPYPLNWVTDHLAVGAAPMSHDALDRLSQAGVTAVLNLCAEFCDLHDIEKEAGFEVYYFPIPDEEAPDMEEMEKALDWLDEAIYLDKKVLIHCRHGIGRTGTVLNAYLLRRGLGHKMAGKTLRHLRSKPQNFSQWWFVRKYGKKSGKLNLREPSLETRNLVDLYPFFVDYESLAEDVDRLLARKDSHCGREHDRCCRRPLELTLSEAVYLSHGLNQTLAREVRLAAVDRAVGLRQRLGELKRQGVEGQALEEKYVEEGLICPLNHEGACLAFDFRPLACRLWDLQDDPDARELRPGLEQGLEKLSGDLFFAFTSEFLEGEPLKFAMCDVASGRFVQGFFHRLQQQAANGQQKD